MFVGEVVYLPSKLYFSRQDGSGLIESALCNVFCVTGSFNSDNLYQGAGVR